MMRQWWRHAWVGLCLAGAGMGVPLAGSAQNVEVAIQLEDAAGAVTSVLPVRIDEARQVTLGFSSKRTGYFPLPEDSVVAQPQRIVLGQKDPDKGWGLRLVRLTVVEGKAQFTMKLGFSGMEPADEAQPLAHQALPKAMRDADGQWRLTLPSALPAGDYAVVTFDDYFGALRLTPNGGGGFSWVRAGGMKGMAWPFRVSAALP